MKKIFTLLLALGSLTSVFAQGGYHNDNRNSNYDQRNQSTVYNNNSRGYDQHTTGYSTPSQWNGQDNRGDERGRQQQPDRNYGDYNRNNGGYRNERPVTPYDRGHGNYGVVNERKEKTKSFTGGVAVGAVAGVLLGVLLSK